LVLNLFSSEGFQQQRRAQMAYELPTQRQPKGDHNRRISLGLDPDKFAAEAGVTTEELREYERTSPDHRFDPAVAERIGNTLDRLEAVLPNSQTGRQEAAGGADPEHVGADGATSAPDHQPPKGPRYAAAGDPQAQTLSQPLRSDLAKRTGDDVPGADGELSAGASKDTYN
jgi:hypothetical protein